MSGIRGKDTKPELAIRSALHRAGFRFRLHRKDLPGRPDLVFPRHDAVLFLTSDLFVDLTGFLVCFQVWLLRGAL